MKRFLISTAALALISSAAYAADAVVEIVPDPVAAGYTWSGAYVGGFIGYAWGNRDEGGRLCPNLDPRDENSDSIDEPQQVGSNSVFVGGNEFGLPDDLEDLYPAYSCRPYEISPGDGNNDGVGVFEDSLSDDEQDGFAYGGFVGVNRQYGKFVFGAELEGVGLDSQDEERSFNFAYFEDTNDLEFLRTIGGGTWTTEGPDWLAQGTIKAGWLFGSMDQALVYIKGGFAVGDKMAMNFSGGSTDDCSDCDGVWSQSLTGGGDTESGYGFGGTIGGGIEYKLTQNFSIGGEYQYTHLDYSEGDSTVTHTMVREFNEGPQDVREVKFTNTFQDQDFHMFKLKGTWHFN